MDTTSTLPIGLFDSGVGGLTVAAALRRRLPGEDLLYLGDTARLPYGTKSPEIVVRYARQAAAFLRGRGIKALVVACNTASAHALAVLAEEHSDIPVLGVVGAGAAAAARASRSGRVIVAATEGTCRSGAFERAIRALRPEAEIVPVPCPLLVALAEEGLTDGPIAEAVAAHYLDRLTRPGDALVLGCTHFPLFSDVLGRVAGSEVALVDCAEAVAEETARLLDAHRLFAPSRRKGRLGLCATDAPDRFSRQAARMVPGWETGAGVEFVGL